MHKHSRLSTISALTISLLLAGCAASSKNTQAPVVSEGFRLTPLPPSVQQIDSTPSVTYLQKVSNWLSKVEGLSSGETPK